MTPLAGWIACVLGIACGPDDDDDDRQPGIAGLDDAWQSLARFECQCIAELEGLGAEFVSECTEEIGGENREAPTACINDVLSRHPEAKAAFDCQVDVMYDYVDCIVGEGCPERFSCDDGEMLPTSWQCDGEPDCVGGEDESATCPIFTCDDGFEIPASARCDGYDDCVAGEDEPADCPATCDSTLENAGAACPDLPPDVEERVSEEIESCYPRFECNDGSDIPEDFRCDGEADCAEGEDESGCADAPAPLGLRAKARAKAARTLGARARITGTSLRAK